MTDRELLEMAAKAVGISGEYHEMGEGMRVETKPGHDWWNPLTDDGDALRLAVALKLEVMFFLGFGEVHSANCVMDGDNKIEPLGVDDYEAVRRAIVRAAAAIGSAMS